MQRLESKRALHLTQGLLVSGALNILLLGFFLFVMTKEKPNLFWAKVKPIVNSTFILEEETSLVETLQLLRKLPFEQLIGKLSDSSMVEDGYTVRDLTLGVMLEEHRFDIDRALRGLQRPFEARRLQIQTLDDPFEVTLYPLLSEEQMSAIEQFAKRERYPFSAEGLFAMLLKQEEPDLLAAFSMTTPFAKLEKLLLDWDLSTDEIAHLVLASDFATFEAASRATDAKQFLKLYLNSPFAAELLLKVDFSYALKKLDDASVISLINLLPADSDLAKSYAKELLNTTRSQAVLLLAGQKFKVSQKPTPKPSEKKYEVESGDSLWKIAKKHEVSITALREKNRLESDTLQPGMLLLIP